MKNWTKKQWALFWSVSLVASSLMLPLAHAELVFDDEGARESDRASSREVISVGYSSTDAVPERVSEVQVEDEAPKLTKSQLKIRKRMREELKTEDMLQERLEELRLKKEQEIANGLMSGMGGYSAPNTDTIASTQAAPASVEVIGSAVPAPVAAQTSVSEVVTLEEESDDEIQISVSPRFGIADFGSASGYQTQSRYSIGGGFQFSFSDHMSLEAGYTYSEYGVNIASSNPFVAVYQNSFLNGANPNFNTLILRQNVGDLGLKVHVLNRKSKIRPFVSAGMGYGQSYVNYDPRIQTYFRQTGIGTSVDYTYTQFLGYLGGGLDIQLAKSVSLGASAKYYSVLSADESSQLNNAAFFAPGMINPLSYDKTAAAGSLSRSGFYTLHLNVNFTF